MFVRLLPIVTEHGDVVAISGIWSAPENVLVVNAIWSLAIKPRSVLVLVVVKVANCAEQPWVTPVPRPNVVVAPEQIAFPLLKLYFAVQRNAATLPAVANPDGPMRPARHGPASNWLHAVHAFSGKQ